MTKNRINLLNLSALICALTFCLGAITACQSNPPTVKAVSNPPTNALPTNDSLPENTKIEVIESPNGSLATPTEAYKTAFTLRQKKNVQGLKLVMSKKMLNFFKEMGEVEQKTIDDQLKELVEQPQAKTAEVRNEKITGDIATIEYLDETGKWKVMNFVKEGSDWKLTINTKPTEKIYDNSTNNKSKF